VGIKFHGEKMSYEKYKRLIVERKDKEALSYLKQHPEIRDMVKNEELRKKIRSLDHGLISDNIPEEIVSLARTLKSFTGW
jgi:hypothetical protein